MGYFDVLCPPPPDLLFSGGSSISFLNWTCFAPKLPASVAPCLFLNKPNNHCTTCYKREQKQRNREKNPKRWRANDKLKFAENLYKKNISVQTSENDVSKSLISIFTFIKELYNSIIAQIPAPISKEYSFQEKRQWESESTRAGAPGGAWSRLGRGGQAASLCPTVIFILESQLLILLGIGLLAACCIYAMQILPFRKLDLHATGVCHW